MKHLQKIDNYGNNCKQLSQQELLQKLPVRQNYCDIKTTDREIEELIKDLPDIKIDRDGKWHFDIKIDNKIKDTEKKVSIINLLMIYSSLFFEGLSIVNDWEACVGT